jgi:hypothetical protein
MRILFLALLTLLFTSACTSNTTPPPRSDYAAWTRGPSHDPNFFPLAVWLQDPADAPLYKAAGINTYVGLWQGPTDAQLATLAKDHIVAVCVLNDVGLKHLSDPTIVAWMHGDEPDNAQTSPGNDAAGNPLPNQPIPPEKVIADYHHLRQVDPSRPILLNLGQGVANDTWPGRGKDNGNLDVYKEYVKAGDIISFDIYPVSGNKNPDRGNLAQEAKGIDRLHNWTHNQKVVWNCIETTQINGDRPDKITPSQMRSCVWISLIHGSKGLIYFCHQFGKGKSPRHLLEDAPMLAAVTAVNKQITDLAPVLNSPTVHDVSVTAGEHDQVDIMVKKHGGNTYIFAASMTRNDKTTAMFDISRVATAATVEVLDESRSISVDRGHFQDTFGPFRIHIYVIRQQQAK